MSDPSEDHRIRLAKAILWEEAKGKLRALAAASGMHQSRHGDPLGTMARFERISDRVATFIKEFEDDGFQE